MIEWEIIVKIIPPLVAVILVMIIRKPIFSLAASCLGGLILISDSFSNFLFNLYRILSDIFMDIWNIKLIVALLILGAFIGIVKKSIANKTVQSEFLNTKKKVLALSWLVGIFMFIDDYFNILINGLLLSSFAKENKISKEKLAFIIHSLGVSACVLIPFSTWAIYILGLLKELGLANNSIGIFIGSIPFNFYSIILIIITLVVIMFELNIFDMKLAEKKMQIKTKASNSGKLPILTIMLPTLVLVGVAFLMMVVGMGFKFTLDSVSNIDFLTILIVSSSIGVIFGSVYYVMKNITEKKGMFKSGYTGSVEMVSVLIILVLAWVLGTISKELGTNEAILTILEPFINLRTLLLLTFIIVSLLSFMTSSWTAFAIIVPVIIPLSIQMGMNPSIALAAIISGGVFGDHMSPISSTTILTKAVSQINISKHFRTQLPYSAIAFGISCCLFFFVGGL